jgi:type IV pilus assembly protein PilE
MACRKFTSRGFTLIELMVVLVVIAVLAALAWPAFTNAMNKSRRSDAMSALANITQAQERWRANNPGFQNDLSLLVGATGAVSSGGHYNLSMVANSVSNTGYKVNAAVRSGSPQISDTVCQVMQVEMAQGNINYRSGPDSAVGNGSPDPCWVR